ncbi:FRG domain-containing protein [Vibrio parahaemolyticus]|uniref:FRG domain-containing protein n=1 Tax=Vibrio parahaemolyticus TaxID=670 RepID=UPI00069EF420|nr:FRG domain-containing protein [Vibrio parahaemolyticus]
MSNLHERSSVRNGIVEIELNSWMEFVEFCDFYWSQDFGLYFRGQRDSNWGLNTTLDRFSQTLDRRCGGTYKTLLSSFTKSLRGRSNVAKEIDRNEDEIWAIGQHNGLATPLLDWTTASYIALFFAFEEDTPSSTGKRTIWAVHKYIAEEMEVFNENKTAEDEFKFVDLITDHNPRLLSQSGVFTKQPIAFNFESWIEERWKGITDRPVMFKVHLPDSERVRILTNLRQMNVHHTSIYPDVIGAAKYAQHELSLLNEKVKKMDNLSLIDHAHYSK